MFNPLLREDCFPLQCANTSCLYLYTLDVLTNTLNDTGLVYVDCGETVCQGFNCVNCGTTVLYGFPRASPLVDLRQFYVVPNAHVPVLNIQEQFFEENRRSDNSSPLDFNFIFPFWNPENISKEELKEEIGATLPDVANSIGSHEYIPYVMDSSEIEHRWLEEVNTHRMSFRRLYPKNTFWYCLLFSIIPGVVSPSFRDTNGIIRGWDAFRMNSSVYNMIYKTAMRHVVEKSSGCLLVDKISEKLNRCGISITEEDIEAGISNHQLDYYFSFHDTLAQLSSRIDFVEQATQFANKIFWKLYYSVCSTIYLSDKRAELSKWVHNVEPGKALFVDAPMGLGKSYSIVETLVDNPELSAVIFMPTKKLCEETVHHLKSRLAHKQNINEYEIFHNMEDARDDDGNVIFDEYGIPERRFKNEFLWGDVYYADGLNKYECLQYDKIMKRYSEHWIKKKDLCRNCEKFSGCRFLQHFIKAPLSRIIVATHLKYESLILNSNIGKWFKHGYSNKKANAEIKAKSEGRKRDFFIIDEDLVLSRCYQPVALGKAKFKAFVSTIIKALDEDEFSAYNVDEIKENVDRLWAQFEKPDTTVIVPPINQKFKISKSVKEAWGKLSSPENQWFIPDHLDWNDIVPNYLDVFENAIRYGYVVQVYDGNFKTEGASFNRRIRKAYLPNPTFFDLKNQPPHVFFDGTIIGETFLKHKLRNVVFEILKIDVPSLWEYNIRQNINSDLPRNKLDNKEKAVKTFVSSILEKEGKEKKFFIVSSKAIRDTYLQKYIDTELYGFDIVFNHYGNLRGFNEAKDCDVGIMLGSYILSDALEIAMTLELFTEEMKPATIQKTEHCVWKKEGSMPGRVYTEKYKIVAEMSKAINLAEQRQAIARTRYLSHDINFYVISKTPLNTYETYFPEIETYQYRNDLFPPRPFRKDNKYQPVTDAVHDWMSKNNTVRRKDIAENYNLHRNTVARHINYMLEQGLLVQVEGKKKVYKYPEN